jgi:vacuolar-type H+-ATPase subunit E/Vma4
MSIEPCLQAEMFMERLRRDSREMSREQLLEVIEHLSRLYCRTKAGANWLAREAALNLTRNVPSDT